MKALLSSVSAVVVALAACTCCVGPLMALAGMLGASVSQLVWLASVKPYLVTFSLLMVSFNLYRAYFPKKEASCCDLNEAQATQQLNAKEKQTLSFLQSKPFLWSIAILTILLLLLPYIYN